MFLSRHGRWESPGDVEEAVSERCQLGPSDCGPAVRDGASSQRTESHADQSRAEVLEGRDPVCVAGQEARVCASTAVDAGYSFLQKGV